MIIHLHFRFKMASVDTLGCNNTQSCVGRQPPILSLEGERSLIRYKPTERVLVSRWQLTTAWDACATVLFPIICKRDPLYTELEEYISSRC